MPVRCSGGATPAQDLSSTVTYEPCFDQIKTRTDPMGNTTTYYYDYELDAANGDPSDDARLARVDYPSVQNENGVWVTPTVTYTYNARGQLKTESDPRGAVTRYVYTQGTAEEAYDGSTPLFAQGVTPVPGLLTRVIQGYGSSTPLTTPTAASTAWGAPK